MSDDTSKKSSKNHHDLDRRRFIRQAGISTVGGALSMSLADRLWGQPKADPDKSEKPTVNTYERRNEVEGVPYVPLGKTNLMVSRMAVGGLSKAMLVVRKSIDLGVNLIHGANEYGTMEEQARTLRQVWDKFWYAVKYNTSESKDRTMANCLERCLKTIKQDHVDIILPTLYGPGKTDFEKLKNEFDNFKKQGKVRFLGATVHTRGDNIAKVCREAVDAKIFDVILTMYQPANKPAIDKELPRAIEKNIGTMSMKTLMGAKGDKGRDEALRAALADGTIHVVLKGLNSMGELRQYMDIVRQVPYSAKPKTSSEQACLEPGICIGCGACGDCPQGVEIGEIMRCATYYRREGQENYARQTYRQLRLEQTVLNCIDCGRCEQICTNRLPVRRLLRDAHTRWA